MPTVEAPLITSRPPQFGKAEDAQPLPAPPESVPAKYVEKWTSLPACCRNFYLSPGTGCCAGMAEPNAAMMMMHQAVPALCEGDNCPIVPPAPAEPAITKTSGNNVISRVVAGVVDWFRQFGRIAKEDAEALINAPKRN